MEDKNTRCEIKGCTSDAEILPIGNHLICRDCLHQAAPFIVAYHSALETMKSGDAQMIKGEIEGLEKRILSLSIYEQAKLNRLRRELAALEVVA